jgi:hypothetical protein
MDKISITYKNSTELVDIAAQHIVDNHGDCTGLNICAACPFINECFDSIKDKAQFLPKSVRLRKAEEFLFRLALEQEIG